MFGDSFFNRVEKKTKVSKNQILSLASKIQNSDIKDEKALREFVKEVSAVAGKEISEEKTNKIVNSIIQDKVPKKIDDLI